MHHKSSTLKAVFETPGREFSPLPFWWWSGEALDLERMRWQMRKLVDGGVYGLIVMNLAPSGPLFGKDADKPPMFSEAWWTIFKGVCEEARRLKMRLYFYDQIGFSGANFQGQLVAGNPAFGGQELVAEEQSVRRGQCVKLPTGGCALAAFIWNGTDEKPECLDISNENVIATADGRLLVVCRLSKGFDYFNPEACQSLLRAVHGQFEAHVGEYFGDVIVGSFQDELPQMPTWGENFAKQFTERYGYDLTGQLWMLWEGDTPEALRARIDYHSLRASLAEEAFFKPFYFWHEDRGLICGFDQQDPARAGDLYGGVRIYGDYLKTHRWYAAPGSDQGGETHVHRSLADAFQRKRVWLEGFHSSGWGGTLEETFDWLLPRLRGGANLYNPHAVYYSTRGGWWEWAPPSTCFRQPYWHHYKGFANTVARCCQALTLGRHICDLAVYYPTLTAQGGACLGTPTPAVAETNARILQLTGRTSVVRPQAGLLDELGRDYNFLDDTMLETAVIKHGGLWVGEQRFRIFILPSAKIVGSAVLTLLLEFVEFGGIVIVFGEHPKYVINDTAGGLLQRWHSACEQGRLAHVHDAAHLKKLFQETPAYIEAPVTLHHRSLGKEHLVFVPASSTMATRNFNREAHGHSREYGYTLERGNYARTMTLLIREPGLSVEAWSPFSGARQPVETQSTPDGTQVTLYFDDGPATWLTWHEAQATTREISPQSPPLRAKGERVLAVLPTHWDCECIPTVDNRYGDLALPVSETLPAQTWFVDQVVKETPDLAEVDWSTATREHVTFGTFGWRKIANDDVPVSTWKGNGLPGAGWEPVIYSLSRGMEFEARNLGPSGHVPEDFIDLGRPESGQAAHFCTWIPSAVARQAILAVGAAGDIEVRWNGEALETKSGFRRQWLVALHQGLNRLEFRVVPVQPGCPLRAQWGMLDRPVVRPWPCRISWPGENQVGRECRFRTDFCLPQLVTEGVIQILSLGPTRLLIDGQEIGCHGAFGPYEKPGMFEAFHYKCPILPAGIHCIEVILTDVGVTPQLTLDADLLLGDGCTLSIISDNTWTVETPELARRSVALSARGTYDPGYETLSRRPQFLPLTDWLEQPEEQSPMLCLTPEAFPEHRRVYWLRWRTPPTATSMYIPVQGHCRAWINGTPVEIKAGEIDLRGGDGYSREIIIRVEPDPGCHDGAVFSGAPTYRLGRLGRIETGDWTLQGLETWSGAVAYMQDLVIEEIPSGRLILDLGEVRGTVEVEVNGCLVGERFCAPWRFNVTNAVHTGTNAIRVTVFNSLAPWLGATSPTIYVFAGQIASGLFGPTHLIVETVG